MPFGGWRVKTYVAYEKIHEVNMKITDRINAAIHPWMRRYCMRAYRREMNGIKERHPEYFGALPRNVEDAHLKLWRGLDPKVSVDWLRLFSAVTGKIDARFVPSTVYYGVIERVLNNCNKSSMGIEDKNIMALYVPREFRANCILRYSRGCFFDDGFIPLSRADAMKILMSYDGDVIGKIAEGSFGGHSVELFQSDVGGRKIGKRHELTVDWIVENVNSYVVQERLIQEPKVKQLNPTSVNTCRLMVYRRPWSGEAQVGASMLRVGRGDGIVDNISSGGMSMGVNIDGIVSPQGFSADFGLLKFQAEQSMGSNGFQVPGFREMCQTAVGVARKVPDFNVLGFDVILRSNGIPCIVEINATSLCAIEVQQSGPMFGSDTEQMIEWCLDNDRFDRFSHLRTWYY